MIAHALLDYRLVEKAVHGGISLSYRSSIGAQVSKSNTGLEALTVYLDAPRHTALVVIYRPDFDVISNVLFADLNNILEMT